MLTVQPDIVEGEDDGSVTLRNSLHGTVDSAIWSLHVMFLYATW